MESYTYQPSVDATMPQMSSVATAEKMTAQAPGTVNVSPQPATREIPVQAPPADATQTPFAAPSAQAMASEQPGQAVSQYAQVQAAEQQSQSHPNVIMDPASGRLYYAMPQGTSVTTAEKMTVQAPGTAPMSPQPAAQELPGQASPTDAVQTGSAAPSVQTAASEQPGQTIPQSSQAQGTEQQAQPHPSVIMDPATGQLYYAMSQGLSVTSAENMTAQAPGTSEMSAQSTGQKMPGQAAPATPSTQTMAPEQPGQTVSQSPQIQDAGQQAPYQSNVIMDPATGQLYYAMPQAQSAQLPPNNGQYLYTTPETQPRQLPEPHQPDYTQIIKSVENFAEGDASVSDVVKTLWTETSQDDQFWKGAIIGAVAAVLFTSETIRGAMGKAFGSISGKNVADAKAPSSTESDIDPKTK